MEPSDRIVVRRAALAAVSIGMLIGCSGGGNDASTPAGPAPTPPTALFPSPIYSEIVPPDAGLAYAAGADTQVSFVAPNGRTVTALVKGPAGVDATTACPGSSCLLMRAIQPGESPDAYFPAAVQAAIAANANKLVIPKNTYVFAGPAVGSNNSDATTCNEAHYYNCPPHWTIGSYPTGGITTPNSIADLDIDLSGSTLDFAAPTTGIWIQNAQRLRLENFTVDWPNLRIASLGTIVADPGNAGHNALVLDDAYVATDPYTGTAVQIQAVDVWDDGPNAVNPQGDIDLSAGNSNETYFIFQNAPQPTFVGKTTAGNQTFSCSSCNFVNSPTDSTCNMFAGCANFDLFPVGTRVLVRHYTYNGYAILVNWSNDVDIENLVLQTGPGSGIGVGNAGGFRGFRLANSSIKRAAGRLISTASDGIDVTNTRGDIIIEGNEIAFQGDDAVNLGSQFQAIASVSSTTISITGGCEPDTADFPIAGDTLAFFDSSLNYLGAAKAGAVSGSLCVAPLSLQVALDCSGDSACPAMVAALTSADSFLDMTQQATGRFVVRNNNFHENRGHGTVVNAPYGLVDGNTYYRNSFGAIAVGASGGPGATNLTISNNTISWPGLDAQYYGAISLQAVPAQGVAPSTVFQKILVSGNAISNTQGPALVTSFASQVRIASNTLSNVDLVTNQPGTTLGFYGNYGSASTKDALVVYTADQVLLCANQPSGATSGVVGIDAASTSAVSNVASCP